MSCPITYSVNESDRIVSTDQEHHQSPMGCYRLFVVKHQIRNKAILEKAKYENGGIEGLRDVTSVFFFCLKVRRRTRLYNSCVLKLYSRSLSWILLTRKMFESQSFPVKIDFGVFVVQHARVTVICICLVIQKHVVNCKLCP